MSSYALYDVVHLRSWPGPLPVNAIVVVGLSAALAFRRVVPFVVLLVVGTSIVTLGVLYGSAQAWSSVFPFVVAVYSAAAYCSTMWAVVVVVIATDVLRDLNDPFIRSFGDATFTSTLAVLTVLAGIEGRRLRQRTVRLDDRAAVLAREEDDLVAAAAAEERQRIARELHDIISHGLALMVLQVGAAEQVVASDPDRARAVMASVRLTGQEAIGELGALLTLMNEGAEQSRQPQPSLADLPALVERANAGGMRVDLQMNTGAVRLSPALELTAVRIVQEGLTNAAKHADGGTVEVVVTATEQQLDIAIIDDGRARTSAPGGRRGLAGMAERVLVFGGELLTGPRPDGGWEVRASLPRRR